MVFASHKPGQFTSLAVPVCVLIISIVCISLGIYFAGEYLPQENAYRLLSQTTDINQNINGNNKSTEPVSDNIKETSDITVTKSSKEKTGLTASTRSWDTLLSANPAITAWITVLNTPIDYPVVSCLTAQDESFYLSHNLWGEPSSLGTPFIDSRCPEEAYHYMVYGHHMTSSNAMFSVLQYAFIQDTFDTLGNLIWDRRLGKASFTPLCALTVDASWPLIQSFSFDSPDSYRNWLNAILEYSTAQNSDAEKLIASAAQDITLVTCTSDYSNQPARTLVVWVR